MSREFSPDVVWRDPNTVTPYVGNAKTHPSEQVDKIASSIAEFGFDQPIVVDGDGVIIKGHGRREAALRIGLSQVPVIVRTDLTPTQVKAARLADNKTAESPWDTDVLRLELETLRDLDYPLGLTGFGDDELGALFADRTAGLTDPDDVPEPPAEPVSKLGDVWLLGRHRLVCGDATSEVDVSLCLGGVRPHLMVTDPPYGVDYDANWREVAFGPGGRATGRVQNDATTDWREAWLLFPGDVAYCWHADRHASSVQSSFEAAGFDIRCQIIWAKSHFVIGRGNYHVQHEPCWYAVRSTAHWAGDRKQTTLWQIDKPQKNETGHSTQKPVECMRRPIENNSSPGQAVYDPFVGSGTTIIAAEMTGRACHALEISPQYVDVAIQRWMNFTGQQATKPDGTPYQAARREAVPAD